jgi:hypothetical protein
MMGWPLTPALFPHCGEREGPATGEGEGQERMR